MSETFPIKPVTDLSIAFGGADQIDSLMPPQGSIPDEFKGRSPWCQLVEDWFFHGLGSIDSPPKSNIDNRAALRHLSAIMRSFAPKHEHKIAAVAFLLSQWFEGPPRWTKMPKQGMRCVFVGTGAAHPAEILEVGGRDEHGYDVRLRVWFGGDLTQPPKDMGYMVPFRDHDAPTAMELDNRTGQKVDTVFWRWS